MNKSGKELRNVENKDIDNGTFTDFNDISVIGYNAFSECRNLENITIPHNIEIIDNEAFVNCTGLKKVIVSDGVKRIKWSAFRNCTSLEDIRLPSNLNRIEQSTFKKCKKLKNITFPSQLKEIEVMAFEGCENLENVDLKEGLIKIFDSAFANCTSLKKAIIPDSVEIIDQSIFMNCSSLKEVKLSKKLKVISKNMFKGCLNLENIELTDDISILNAEAFCDCKSLNKIIFSKNLKKISTRCFSGCEDIEKIELNEGIEDLGAFAFRGCKSLKNITIPKSIKNIRYNTFEGCNALEELNYNGVSYDLNKYNGIFIDKKKDDKSSIIKLICMLDEPYTIKHNVKFPSMFIAKLEKEQIKKLLEKDTVKHFKNIYTNNISNNTYRDEELLDFYKFAYNLGCFNNEEIIIDGKRVNVAQKASVFLKEILDKNILNIKSCHDLFDGLQINEYNPSFIKFITYQEKNNIENQYQNLMYLLNKGRTLSTIINNFNKIEKTLVTDKQGRIIQDASIKRKIETYLSSYSFSNVEIGNEDLAKEFLKFHAIDQSHFDEAQEIRKRTSKNHHILNEDLKEDTIVDTIDKVRDKLEKGLIDSKKLLEELYDKEFIYEWLDKYDPRNFTLGLYCDCCASIVSAFYGKGIMKDSITKNNVQNLVIKDNCGTIIAKATIYVNKEKGYAVFNDIEMNRIYGNEMAENEKSDDTKRVKIYKAFKRGCKDFVKKYNEIYKDNPITQVNIGWGYNRLKQTIKKFEEKSDILLEAIDSFQDAKNEQWIMYKK